ncbi:hypothetical protein FAES_3873 [Fibrella aestuarina BUZ 2]|uniref:Endonuclease GajA/Old nuclease/RecF-like AAA domain-containing protein n=1 Tax=Fibrella aestuarina BUZ 2 TaxID=1166018 RepID=I0KCM6_9BACT|nr:AAA family ATPase [Fibrella aestuarina]CCH01879.1 hypothetical protein FAES_3873 [Fibrella aestuarina BUZ 2]
MFIKKFNVKNYKSIVDSGDCYLEADMTILAGKNESGKSSILEALHDFNVSNSIDRSSVPLDKRPEDLAISITFLASENEIKDYLGIRAVSFENGWLEITVTKDFYDRYFIQKDLLSFLKLVDIHSPEYLKKEKELLQDSYNEFKDIYEEFATSINLTDLFVFDSSDIEGSRENLQSEIEALVGLKEEDNDDTTQSTLSSYIKILSNFYNVLSIVLDQEQSNKEQWDKFLSFLPNFIIFKSFEDILPNSISFEKLKESPFIQDLASVSSIDVELLLSSDTRRKIKHKGDINFNINTTYSTYWNQDKTELKIDWDSNDLTFWVEEESELYSPTQRSKGKQWHLSFYLKTSARTIDNKTNILLVDEPGLFLHAKAQRDIYDRLLNTSQNQNIQSLFTTHSPYLIRHDELQRIRLVQKSSIKLGTQIISKLHAVSDKETLTPIMTAIGLELNQGIQNINQANNIVVEGPSDVHYFNAFSTLINDKSINFVFGGGSGNMGNIGAILTGWGCNVGYIYDNDKGKADGVKNLKNTWFVDGSQIFSVTDILNGSIEDIFTVEEFKLYILEDEEQEISGTVSDFMKSSGKFKSKINKVLASKKFLTSVNKKSVNLSEETLTKIRNVFENLKSIFYNSHNS